MRRRDVAIILSIARNGMLRIRRRKKNKPEKVEKERSLEIANMLRKIKKLNLVLVERQRVVAFHTIITMVIKRVTFQIWLTEDIV
jgi:hypothetical protein